MTQRELSLVCFLAARGGQATRSQVIDAVWNGRAVEPKTLRSLLYETRTKLGDDALPPRRGGGDQTIALGPMVTTDLAAVEAALHAGDVAGLDGALGLVRGPAFDAAGMAWADHHQDAERAGRLVEQAALTLVELAAGDVDVARRAVAAGLRALPGNEALYRCRMRLEAATGGPVAVRAVYAELARVLGDHESVPSPDTDALLAQLTA